VKSYVVIICCLSRFFFHHLPAFVQPIRPSPLLISTAWDNHIIIKILAQIESLLAFNNESQHRWPYKFARPASPTEQAPDPYDIMIMKIIIIKV